MRKSEQNEALVLEVVKSIRDNWGVVLNPVDDPNRWTSDLQRLFPYNSVFNWTDFNYGKAHSYEIVLHEGKYLPPHNRDEERAVLASLGGLRYSMLLRLSVVAPYYSVQFLRRKLDADGQIQDRIQSRPWRNADVKALVTASRFCDSHHFEYLNDEVLTAVIPDVELELAEEGTVTVFNCLFEDFSHI